MKIAVISQDGRTVSQHFGRAPWYLVFTVEGGAVMASETRPKAGHHQFHGDPGAPETDPEDRHRAMAGSIEDCQALIAGGMGMGAFESLRRSGIEPVLTDEGDPLTAALRYAAGDLPHQPRRLHAGGHGH
jgi:predicted Fe-Mo cluster-binding NifX family protein